MAVKEAAAGSVVVGGSGAGIGYIVYKSSFESIGDILYKEAISKENDKNIGVPITKLNTASEQNDWWKKAFHRYFLEIEGTEEVPGAGKKSDRNEGDDSKKEAFKKGCIEMLSQEKKGENDSNYVNAKKWCVTYRTVKEQLESGKQTLKDRNDSDWETKYNIATNASTTPAFAFKTTLEKFNSKSNESTDGDKKKEAMHKLCTMAMDASSEASKSAVSSNCAFKNG